MKLASGFCIPEPLPVHTGIKGRQVHPLIRSLLRSRVDENVLDEKSPQSLSSLFCSWLASRCSQRSPSQQRFSWALRFCWFITRPVPSPCSWMIGAGRGSQPHSAVNTKPVLLQELRTATDFALRATKVTARSLGKAMSTMVVQSACRRGCPPASYRAAPPRAKSTPRPARWAFCRRAGNPKMLAFALFQETARTVPLFPPEEGREENPVFLFISVPPLVQGTHFFKKRAISFFSGFSGPRDDSVQRVVSSFSPRPILPAAKRARFGDAVPPHALLGSPVWDPGSSARMSQNALPSVPSSPTPLCCTTTCTSIVPLEPLRFGRIGPP